MDPWSTPKHPSSLPLQTRQNIHVESALERRQLQPGEIHSATNPIADARMVFGSCVSMKSIYVGCKFLYITIHICIVESSLLTNLDVGRSQGQLFKSNIERFVLFRIEHTYEWRLNISYTKIVLTSHPASPVMFNHWYYRYATNDHDKTLNTISKSVYESYTCIWGKLWADNVSISYTQIH